MWAIEEKRHTGPICFKTLGFKSFSPPKFTSVNRISCQNAEGLAYIMLNHRTDRQYHAQAFYSRWCRLQLSGGKLKCSNAIRNYDNHNKLLFLSLLHSYYVDHKYKLCTSFLKIYSNKIISWLTGYTANKELNRL